MQRQNVYVAKTKLYVIKTNLYVIKTKSICKTKKIYVIKTKFICSKDKVYMLQRQKSTVLGLSAPAGAFFSQKETLFCFENAI